MNDDIPKKWVGGICVKNESVLLIYRINKEKEFNQEYFVFPGGQVEGDESIEDTLIREFKESSVTAGIGELFYSTEEDINDEADYYYTCNYVMGEPSLSEASRNQTIMEDGNQIYTPMWVPLRELEELIVYPETVKNKVIEELSQ